MTFGVPPKSSTLCLRESPSESTFPGCSDSGPEGLLWRASVFPPAALRGFLLLSFALTGCRRSLRLDLERLKVTRAPRGHLPPCQGCSPDRAPGSESGDVERRAIREASVRAAAAMPCESSMKLLPPCSSSSSSPPTPRSLCLNSACPPTTASPEN